MENAQVLSAIIYVGGYNPQKLKIEHQLKGATIGHAIFSILGNFVQFCLL